VIGGSSMRDFRRVSGLELLRITSRSLLLVTRERISFGRFDPDEFVSS